MGYLKLGSNIKTITGEHIIIGEPIGQEGGQGCVYKVTLTNNAGKKDFALKWYPHGITWHDSDDFYDNLKNNMGKDKSPAPTFLWPINVTQEYDGCFGYIMDLIPQNYIAFSDFLLNIGPCKNFTVNSTINAAMQLIASFDALHNKGLAYLDLNNGNLFIDPTNGNILLCDNDNVVPSTKQMGVQGKTLYMAPEVMAEKTAPDIYSDRFSLAVVLFYLFCEDPPLLGQKSSNKKGPAKNENDLLCNNPIFIFDPVDRSNAPILGGNAEKKWQFYPQHIRDIFIKAFDKSLMLKNDPNNKRQQRVLEKEWFQEFARLRNELLICPYCGKVNFVAQEKFSFTCSNCGKKTDFYRLITSKYAIPLQEGRPIYMYEVSGYSNFTIDSVTTIIGKIILSLTDSRLCGLQNLSTDSWQYYTPGGKTFSRGYKKVIPIISNIQIRFGSEKGTIQK